ncbi:ATP-binding cassette domain-containing protein [Vibrio sp. PP-XX7]
MSRPYLMKISDLQVQFSVSTGLFTRQPLHAVNHVSLTLMQGSIMGLVGESGSGKSTLGRALLQLEKPTGGSIDFEGLELIHATRPDIARLRQQTAMIFQNPLNSLNPRQSIGAAIGEVLRVHRKRPPSQIEARVDELLTLTGLSPEYKTRYPHELSGGQCQQAAIARRTGHRATPDCCRRMCGCAGCFHSGSDHQSASGSTAADESDHPVHRARSVHCPATLR